MRLSTIARITDCARAPRSAARARAKVHRRALGSASGGAARRSGDAGPPRGAHRVAQRAARGDARRRGRGGGPAVDRAGGVPERAARVLAAAAEDARGAGHHRGQGAAARVVAGPAANRPRRHPLVARGGVAPARERCGRGRERAALSRGRAPLGARGQPGAHLAPSLPFCFASLSRTRATWQARASALAAQLDASQTRAQALQEELARLTVRHSPGLLARPSRGPHTAPSPCPHHPPTRSPPVRVRAAGR